MTTGNEPNGPGGDASRNDAADDKTAIVQRPETAAPGAQGDDPGADATTISQLPSTTPSSSAAPSSATPSSDPFAAGTHQYTQAGVPTTADAPQASAQPTEQIQPGQVPPSVQNQPTQVHGQPVPQPPQSGQPQSGQPHAGQPQPGQPVYGQTPVNAPQYGQTPQNAPQYAPGPQQPQYGQPGAPAYGPTGAPAYGQPGAPAYGPTGAPAYGQPGAPGQPFGQPNPQGADPTLNPYAPAPKAASGKGKLIGIIGGAVVLIAAIVLITAFVWPNWAKGSLSQDSVQSGVQKILTTAEPDGYGIKDVKDVQCPSGQKVEAGTTFTCSVKVNGENKHVTVTVKDAEGTFEISRPTN